MTVFIKERSRLARIAARQLRMPRAAIVIGNTIYLWGTTRHEFLQTPSWVRHEVAHVYQYKKYGSLLFIYLYLRETSVNGYYQNRFEKEARSKERDKGILDKIEFR